MRQPFSLPTSPFHHDSDIETPDFFNHWHEQIRSMLGDNAAL